jgi:hypothetical protein
VAAAVVLVVVLIVLLAMLQQAGIKRLKQYLRVAKIKIKLCNIAGI